MVGHTEGSVLNDDSECPGRGSRTPAVRARSSSSQPVAVGSAAGRTRRSRQWAKPEALNSPGPARVGSSTGRGTQGRGASLPAAPPESD